MALTKISGSILKDPLNLGGEVSIGGTLTYQDVTNVDALGIGTFRSGINVSGGQLDVGSNIKLGNAGVITATSFVGDGSGLTGAGPSLTGSTNNTVVTVTGSNAIQGEANLTFDGSKLGVNVSSPSYTLDVVGDAGGSFSASTNSTAGVLSVVGKNNAGNISAISRIKSHPSGSGNTSDMSFQTRNSSSQMVERARIKSNGNIILGSDGTNSELTFSQDGTSGVILNSTTTGFGGYNTFTINSASFIHKYGGNERFSIASDGNVHINTTDNGNASAQLNIEDSSSVGADVLKIMNKPSGANGKAKLVFHTETSAGQGCQPYIQSLSGADAGPNASNNHNAGGFEFHTRSGGAGTDNNALRIRDDGSFEKYGANGTILMTATGSDMQFSRGGRNQIYATHSNGYFDFHTGGQTTYPAIRIFATPDVTTGAKVGINTDTIGVDTQMSVMASRGKPALYTSYGMRIMPHGANSFNYPGQYISNAAGIYVIHTTVPANNTWTQVAAGRYHGATVTCRVGDASSKRTIFANYDFTAPNYGVAHYNEIANNGAWNTGSASMRLGSAGTYDYSLEVQHNSYYNTNNTSSVYLIFNVS